MEEAILERFRRALGHGSLVEVVLDLKNKGRSQRNICDHLETFRKELRAQKREVDEEILMEVMDLAWGWCSPQNALFESSLPNEEVPPQHEKTSPNGTVR